ncbi:hypothetical protein HHK36_023388 [Tetracentron sinense]|uniref:Glycine-rich protein n=1 Tax=Tetracentron sinense TaxID=13715 RepID=A0A834YR48_TETSI|nr:hypothetical protein HHK36_023388 [Tetracentron sinense]
MAFSKASQVMVMAIFVATLFLWSFEVATAGFQEAIPLGRRVLGVPIKEDFYSGGDGRGGYNKYQPIPTYPPP